MVFVEDVPEDGFLEVDHYSVWRSDGKVGVADVEKRITVIEVGRELEELWVGHLPAPLKFDPEDVELRFRGTGGLDRTIQR